MKNHSIDTYTTESGKNYKDLNITYQVFGRPLHSAPIVIVNHALTGNSDVLSEEKGWWKELVGEHKLVDTHKYTVIAFNFPGNGYDGNIISSYEDFNLKDIAKIFLQVIQHLAITQVHAIIGGSIGGALAWQMAALAPKLASYIIPIAANWEATDWVLGYCTAQRELLNHSSQPLSDARIMAMLFYRTPQSLSNKFNRTRTESGQFNIDSWLLHHGKKLESRFDLTAYKTMNHLLATADIAYEQTFEMAVQNIKSTIIQIAIDTDFFFAKEENIKAKERLDKIGISNEYHEVTSIHGHDGFLIEFEQIIAFLKPIFR